MMIPLMFLQQIYINYSNLNQTDLNAHITKNQLNHLFGGFLVGFKNTFQKKTIGLGLEHGTTMDLSKLYGLKRLVLNHFLTNVSMLYQLLKEFYSKLKKLFIQHLADAVLEKIMILKIPLRFNKNAQPMGVKQ